MDDDHLIPSEFDPERIIEMFDRHKVQYVLIGGLAAALHGSPQPTVDIDIAPELSPSNLDRLAAALRELGATQTTDGHSLNPPQNSTSFEQRVETFFSPVGEVDVLREALGGGGYEELIGQSVNYVVGNIEITTISLSDLIRAKEASNRTKDQLALIQLRLLKELQSGG